MPSSRAARWPSARSMSALQPLEVALPARRRQREDLAFGPAECACEADDLVEQPPRARGEFAVEEFADVERLLPGMRAVGAMHRERDVRVRIQLAEALGERLDERGRPLRVRARRAAAAHVEDAASHELATDRERVAGLVEAAQVGAVRQAEARAIRAEAQFVFRR